MSKIILSLSGGMDSATLLAYAKDKGYSVLQAVSFSYGSKHNKYELQAAETIAQFYSTPHRLINMEGVFAGFKSNLMLCGGDIPEGHYEAKNMELTVVPARNIIFASVLAGVAWSLGAEEVWLGAHSGDHAIYPDCRPDFFHHMRLAMETGTGGKVTLQAPFLQDNKTTILKIGRGLGVPYRLTRTCYANQEKACGKCGSCQERLAAFAANGETDLLEYESREILPKT